MVSIASVTRWENGKGKHRPSELYRVLLCHAFVASSPLVLLVIIFRFHWILLIWSLPGTLAYPYPSFSLYHLFSQYLIQFSFIKWLLFLKCRSLQNKTEAPNLVCKTSDGCFLHPSIICTLLAVPYLFVILS